MVTSTYGIGGDELPDFVVKKIKAATLEELDVIRSIHPGLWPQLNRCSRCEDLIVLYPNRTTTINLPATLKIGSVFLGSERDETGKEPPKHISTKLCSACVQEFNRQEQEISRQKIELLKKFGIPYPYNKF